MAQRLFGHLHQVFVLCDRSPWKAEMTTNRRNRQTLCLEVSPGGTRSWFEQLLDLFPVRTKGYAFVCVRIRPQLTHLIIIYYVTMYVHLPTSLPSGGTK